MENKEQQVLCKLCGKEKANHNGSHVISHLLLNDTLSESSGNNRGRGVLFEMGGLTGSKFQIDPGVLPERIEEFANDSVDTTLERSSNLSTVAGHYCNDCETSEMNSIETNAAKSWSKLRSEQTITKNDEEKLHGLVVLQLMRIGHANLHGIELNESWIANAEQEIKSILAGTSIEKKFKIRLVKFKKPAKTAGLFLVNSLTQNPRYLIIDDVVIIITANNGTEEPIEDFWNLGKYADIKNDEHLTVKYLTQKESDEINQTAKIHFRDQQISVFMDIAKYCLKIQYGFDNLGYEGIKIQVNNVVQKLNTATLLSHGQFGYLFMTINSHIPRDTGTELHLFGRAVNEYFN